MPTRSTTGDGQKPTTYTFDDSSAPWDDLLMGHIGEYAGTATSPTTLYDITSNEYDLTVNAGSITEIGGIHGDCFLPGTNGASFNPPAAFDSLTSYTQIYLVRVNSDTNDTNNQTIGRMAGSTAQDTFLITWAANENVLFNAEDDDTTSNSIQIGDGIYNNDGEYVTIALVVNGTDEDQFLYVIVDGETTQTASDTASGLSGGSSDNDNYWIGHGTVDVCTFDFEASYFFDSALSQTQIEAIHTNPYSWNSGSDEQPRYRKRNSLEESLMGSLLQL